MSYNLDAGNDDESVEFILGGHSYRLRIPTTNEALDLGAISSNDPTKARETLDAVYKFVSPVNEGTPSFKDTLGDLSVKKLKAFMQFFNQQVDIEA